MRNTNKKGFTIVELVIVVAVIAILAAVLIPTFSSLIKKANQSSDIQATRQMNTALAIAGELSDIDAVIDALAEAGFNSKDALIPVSTGYTFYWYANAKQIVLENDKGEVIFPEGVAKEEGVSLESNVKYIDIESANADTLAGAFAEGNEKITLSDNVSIGAGSEFIAPKDSEIVLDLNGKTITAEMSDGYKHVNVIQVHGKVTIKNGVINTRNIMVYEGGELIIEEGVTINALDTDGGAAIWVYGGEVTVTGAKINSGSFTYAIVTHGGNVTLNNVEVTADRGAVSATAGTVTINGGKYTVTNNRTDAAHVIYAYNGVVTITGGEFINENTGYKQCVDGSGTGSITLPDGTKLVAGQYK